MTWDLIEIKWAEMTNRVRADVPLQRVKLGAPHEVKHGILPPDAPDQQADPGKDGATLVSAR